MKSSYISVPVAFLSLAGTALLLARAQDQGRALDALRREVASRPHLDAPLDAARAPDRGHRAVARMAPPPAPAADEPRGAEAGARGDAGAPIQPEDARARFDAIFEEETTDVAWARERSRVLTNRIEAVLPTASTLRSLECHSAVCRVETVHEDDRALGAFVNGGFRRFDTKITTGASFTTTLGQDERGRIILVSYFAGEGETLPDITQAM